MTAPALQFFPTITTPVVLLDYVYLGPAVPTLLRVCQRRTEEQPVAFEHSVEPDGRNCPFCEKPVTDREPRQTIAIIAGEWRYCHSLCRVAATGREPMSVRKHSAHLPDCRRCGEPFMDGHNRYMDGAYCEDGEPYEPANA